MESSSIQTQKEMLTRYAQENGIVNTTFYVDDGYSGTNFDRPDFQRMIEDIEAGKINMVLTKDLSRLGRDYIIIPNVHEAIVSPEDYELVQTMITSRRNNTGREGKLENIFAGLIKCEDCGYALTLATAHRTKKDNILDNYGYMCNQYKTFGKSKCTSHWIEARDLYDAVLADIQRHAAMARAEDEVTDNAEQFTRLIREYAGIEELDAALLNTLIDKITVGEAKEVDGEKVQEVKIYYKFIGFIAGQEV